MLLDVTDPLSISSAREITHRITNGKLDYLINNAGYGYMMPLLDTNPEDVRRNLEVNVIGLLEATKAFFQLLRAAKGTVVNQSSIAGLPGCYQPFIGTYTMTKSAVSKLSDTMRVESAPFDVKVITLVTGDVRTHFWDNVRGTSAGLAVSSPHQTMREKAQAVMSGATNPPGQHSRERYANEVVTDLLRASPLRHVRRGFLAKTMWIMNWLFIAVSVAGLALRFCC